MFKMISFFASAASFIMAFVLYFNDEYAQAAFWMGLAIFNRIGMSDDD